MFTRKEGALVKRVKAKKICTAIYPQEKRRGGGSRESGNMSTRAGMGHYYRDLVDHQVLSSATRGFEREDNTKQGEEREERVPRPERGVSKRRGKKRERQDSRK